MQTSVTKNVFFFYKNSKNTTTKQKIKYKTLAGAWG